MKRVPVVSSAVADVGYDPVARVLEVGVRSGSVYRYRDVPARVADELVHAPSVGRYLAANVRDAYRYERVS